MQSDYQQQLEGGFRTLVFSPDLEKEYQADTETAGLAQLRVALIIGSLFGLAFPVMDYLFDGPEKEKGREFMKQIWFLGKERKVKVKDFEMLADYYFGGLDRMEKIEFSGYTEREKLERRDRGHHDARPSRVGMVPLDLSRLPTGDVY